MSLIVSINAGVQNVAKQCPCAWELRMWVLFWRAAIWRYTLLISFHSACFGVCISGVFGQIFELEAIQLSIHLHLINLSFSMKYAALILCYKLIHKMDLLPRGVWHPWKDLIFLIDSCPKNSSDPALFFFWEEKFEVKLWCHGNSVIKNWTGR